MKPLRQPRKGFRKSVEMDYSVQADLEHRVVLVTLGRVVSEESALAAYEAVGRFIAASGPHARILDFSAVEQFKISAQFVWHLAQCSPMIPDGMARVVVAPRPAIYGMSRMFQILRDNQSRHLEVVRILDEALKFLGLESPQFKLIDSNHQLRWATP